MKNRLESTTCDKIMAELDNWIYDSSSDQKIRELLERPHKVPQTIPKISSQSGTQYKQSLQLSSRLLFVVLLPTIHSTELTLMKCAALLFCWTGLCGTYPNTTKYLKWWTRDEEDFGEIPRSEWFYSSLQYHKLKRKLNNWYDLGILTPSLGIVRLWHLK